MAKFVTAAFVVWGTLCSSAAEAVIVQSNATIQNYVNQQTYAGTPYALGYKINADYVYSSPPGTRSDVPDGFMPVYRQMNFQVYCGGSGICGSVNGYLPETQFGEYIGYVPVGPIFNISINSDNHLADRSSLAASIVQAPSSGPTLVQLADQAANQDFQDAANAKKSALIKMLMGKVKACQHCVAPDPDMSFRVRTTSPASGVRGSLDAIGTTLTEASPAWVAGDATFASDASGQETNYFSMLDVGDGDYLEAEFNNHVLWSTYGQSLEANTLYSASYDISQFAGQSGTISIFLHSVGERNAQALIVTDILEPTPEPGEWTMIAGGLALVGGIARRRRSR